MAWKVSSLISVSFKLINSSRQAAKHANAYTNVGSYDSMNGSIRLNGLVLNNIENIMKKHS